MKYKKRAGVSSCPQALAESSTALIWRLAVETSTRRNMSGNPCGLNRSTQHWYEVHLQELQKLRSFANLHSSGTLPCLGLIEYSRTVRLSGGSIVGSTD